MDYSEFLILFSNEGEYDIDVKFKGHPGFVKSMKMNPDEIVKLISPEYDFYTEMTFDDYLLEIYRYHIDPFKKKITIMVRDKTLEIDEDI